MINISVYDNVTNAAQIRSVVMNEEGELIDPTMRGAIVDLSLISNKFHLELGAYKALMNEKCGTMKTKSISSEILYYLSGSCKITEALKQYSIQPESQFIAVIDLSTSSADSISHIRDMVDGAAVDVSQLESPECLSGVKVMNDRLNVSSFIFFTTNFQ